MDKSARDKSEHSYFQVKGVMSLLSTKKGRIYYTLVPHKAKNSTKQAAFHAHIMMKKNVS
jgi:hypothetical protein